MEQDYEEREVAAIKNILEFEEKYARNLRTIREIMLIKFYINCCLNALKCLEIAAIFASLQLVLNYE